jgi:hypothetical protein
MAQASLSSTTNSSTTAKVPFEERNNVKTPADLHGVVVRYHLGEAAIADTVNKAQQLRKKVATVINRHAVDDVGIVQTRWRTQPVTQRSHMVKNLVNSASWLANFEGDWATEWLLRRQIDMRHSEGQRKPKEKSRKRDLLSTGELDTTPAPTEKNSPTQPASVPVPPSPASPHLPPKQRKRSKRKAASPVDDEIAEVRARKWAKQQANCAWRNGAEEARRLLDAESD